MSINLINLAAPILGRVSYLPAGHQTKSGSIMKFAKLSMRLGLADDALIIGGQTYPLAGQELWVSLDVPRQRGGQATDEGRIKAFSQAVESGQSYALITECVLTCWTGKNGVQYEVKAKLENIRLDAKPTKQSNFAMLSGNIQEQGQGWLSIEDRYLSTVKEGGETRREWKSRILPVWVGGDLPTSPGSHILVYGRLATKAWDGSSKLYVVANKVL